jgi:hypothetical protein
MIGRRDTRTHNVTIDNSNTSDPTANSSCRNGSDRPLSSASSSIDGAIVGNGTGVRSGTSGAGVGRGGAVGSSIIG